MEDVLNDFFAWGRPGQDQRCVWPRPCNYTHSIYAETLQNYIDYVITVCLAPRAPFFNQAATCSQYRSSRGEFSKKVRRRRRGMHGSWSRHLGGYTEWPSAEQYYGGPAPAYHHQPTASGGYFSGAAAGQPYPHGHETHNSLAPGHGAEVQQFVEAAALGILPVQSVCTYVNMVVTTCTLEL